MQKYLIQVSTFSFFSQCENIIYIFRYNYMALIQLLQKSNNSEMLETN